MHLSQCQSSPWFSSRESLNMSVNIDKKIIDDLSEFNLDDLNASSLRNEKLKNFLDCTVLKCDLKNSKCDVIKFKSQNKRIKNIIFMLEENMF